MQSPHNSGPVRPKTCQDGSTLHSLGEKVVRAGGLEPPRPIRVCGFSYHFDFRRPDKQVRGLDYPFTMPPNGDLGAARLVSTPSRTSGLGSGLPLKVSPTLSSSAPPVSLAGTQFLKSAVSADFTTPARK
jgi:hypothetical protein